MLKSKTLFFYSVGGIVLLALMLLVQSASKAETELPTVTPAKLLPELEKIKARLQKDLGDPLELKTERQTSYTGKADSLVEYTIAAPSPNRYYSITISTSYFPNSSNAQTAFRSDYDAFHDKEQHTEGLLEPELHYRIGNCIFDVRYGCCLNKTNTEKMLKALFESLYNTNEKANSFNVNYCGGGSTHSPDLGGQ